MNFFQEQLNEKERQTKQKSIAGQVLKYNSKKFN